MKELVQSVVIENLGDGEACHFCFRSCRSRNIAACAQFQSFERFKSQWKNQFPPKHKSDFPIQCKFNSKVLPTPSDAPADAIYFVNNNEDSAPNDQAENLPDLSVAILSMALISTSSSTYDNINHSYASFIGTPLGKLIN